MMNLKALSGNDLANLLEAFRHLAGSGNRFFLELFCAVEREMLLRHESISLSELSEKEVTEALHQLDSLVTNMSKHVPGDHPVKRFVVEQIEFLLGENQHRNAGRLAN